MTPDDMKRLRERKRLSTKDMARLLGLTQRAVQRWESGEGAKPLGPVVILYRLLEAGKLTTDDIRELGHPPA